VDIIIALLAFLFILTVIVTVVGHGIWVALAALTRSLQGNSKPFTTLGVYNGPAVNGELISDLLATQRQIRRFQGSGKIDSDICKLLLAKLELEKSALLGRLEPNGKQARADGPIIKEARTSVVEIISTQTTDATLPTPVPLQASITSMIDVPVVEDTRKTEPPKPAPPKAAPRKPLTEVIAAFMEESNIRWGEIIGGLLIIGCSTALVVSLWAQISEIPVLKFLIFTTVTAALFGIGLYTEHRWKLPTTSRGILTIATLLVPLNFLAIAAVSSNLAPDLPVIISELIAPAVFLCLVYFAGRVLTPSWPHLLTAGVLGSSVGQLLVRHFAAIDSSPALLVFLGAFPILAYVASAIWMLRLLIDKEEISETETTSIFITLGALTFAATLPFGLLLYKSGPIGMTMMYLAPLISFGGLPALAVGTILWRRVTDEKLLTQRMAGTTLAVLGTLTVLLGMVLAWPNPSSIIPAALLNFAVFTVLAIWLEIPAAHFIASLCFGLAYLVFFHVLAGHVSWQNLRVTSLLNVSLTASSGQIVTLLCLSFLGASEWLVRKGRERDGSAYFGSALFVGCTSLLLLSVFALGINGDPSHASVIFAIYAAGALWIAVRRKLPGFSWIGSAMMLAALAQACARFFDVSFPWQTALLLHATFCAAAAIASSRFKIDVLTKPLNSSALISSFAVVICLVEAGRWENTAMQAERVLWLAVVWLSLLWLNRRRSLLTLFQMALVCGVALSIKAVLQQFEWYAYLPHAFMHPWSLQIQGTILLLICLGWTTLRLFAKRVKTQADWLRDARRILDAPLAFDRMLSWAILFGFGLLAIYGAWSGVIQELRAGPVWNIAGFPHQEAIGLGSWIVLGLLVITMLLNFRERRNFLCALGAIAGLTTAIPLLAGQWESQVATASAWRWSAALFLVIASVPIWYRKRLVETLGLYELGRLPQHARNLILTFTLTPLLLLTVYPALQATFDFPLHGPSSGAFALLNDELLYGLPLLFASVALILYSVRDKSTHFALAGGLLLNLTATIVYLFSLVGSIHAEPMGVLLVRVILLNSIVFALYALGWLTTRNRWLTRISGEYATQAKKALGIQIVSCIASIVIVLVPMATKLILQPDRVGLTTFEAGNVRGWLAFVLTLLAAGWYARVYLKRIAAGYLFAALTSATCLLSFTAARWDVANWSGYHTFIIGTALTSALILVAGLLVKQETQVWWQRLGLQLSRDWRWDCAMFATVGGLFSVFLSFRALSGEPSDAWWIIAPLLGTTVLAAALHWQTLKRAYLYAAGILFTCASLIWWNAEFTTRGKNLEIIIISLCVSSVAWLLFELRARKVSGSNKYSGLSLHNLTSIGSLILISLIVLYRLAVHIVLYWTVPHGSFDATALGSLVLILLACLWDKRAKHTVPSLYIAGLLVVGLTLDQLYLVSSHLFWAIAIGMAIFTLTTALAWHYRDKILRLTDRLKMPRRIGGDATSLTWLCAFNIAVALMTGLIAYTTILEFSELPLRLTAAIAVGLQAITFALLAEGPRRGVWLRAAIAMFLVSLVLFGWGWLTPYLTGTWLNRAVIMMVEMFAVTALYSLILQEGQQRKPDWTNAVRKCVPWILGAGTVALIFTLCTEVSYQINFGAVRINSISLIAIGLTLIAAIGVCLLFALSPRHEPIGLSETGRMKYVYAAEIVLALLFMHVRLTMPWLFTGFFDDYWPLVVIVVAYLGVISSEALKRRKLLVLAQPIECTGAFLPLLPVIGFWVTQSRVDYSVLLFLVGGVYAGLSILRRSFAFGLLAAIAGNGGLWYIWHRTQNYGFLQHPQLWLIPVALSILIAAYLNRDHFSEEQQTGVRYFALLMIYASSTADIFVNGVADSPWLPLILAAVSLCGIFAGVSLRIRGLLVMGSVFLLFAILTMIYYATVNLGWTWLWYVAGIVTGATIIFMFAVFEKKRVEVLRMVDGLKEWSA
jgi:hypothetical protein